MGQTERSSLDAWATICGLAAVTSTLRLGTLVSPVTFRHPSVLAKNVVTADHISGGGRIELGMGSGWLEAEHDAYGFPFPPTGERVRMFEEQIEIVRRQWDPEPFDFDGEHYRIKGGNAQPKPISPPNLIVGGSAKPRTLAAAARWADEYNLVMMSAEQAREAVPLVRKAWEDAGRQTPVISLMTHGIIGSDRSTCWSGRTGSRRSAARTPPTPRPTSRGCERTPWSARWPRSGSRSPSSRRPASSG